MSKTILAATALAVFAMSPLWGQQQDPKSDMSNVSASEMHDMYVYPFEQRPEDIWSVERQAHNHME